MFAGASCAFVPEAAARCDAKTPYRIAIDIGHSPAAPGAQAASGKTEYEFNRRFAEELTAESKSRPSLALTIMNPKGENLALEARTRIAARRKSDVFVSIHHDSVQPKYLKKETVGGKERTFTDTIRGYSLFAYTKNVAFKRSLVLATLIGKNVAATGRTPALHHAEPIAGENKRLLDKGLGIYDANLAVLRTAASPAVLVEVGVIPNPADEEFVDRLENRKAMQSAILKALEDFCE
jgi:N-acetylmuramoyl-L-alanine amidase